MANIDNFHGEHAFLSNFYPSPIEMDNKMWPTVEHAYQACKTRDPAEREKIRQAKTPGVAKRLGRQVKLREDWEACKLYLMDWLLRKKFAIPALKTALEATKGYTLVEGNTWNDTFWGVCRGKGKNHLGRLLMDIRDLPPGV